MRSDQRDDLGLELTFPPAPPPKAMVPGMPWLPPVRLQPLLFMGTGCASVPPMLWDRSGSSHGKGFNVGGHVRIRLKGEQLCWMQKGEGMRFSRFSRTNTAAPSPMTKPSRSTSKGREASCGSSFLVERALRALKELTPMRLTTASLPPLIAAWASPRLMSS